MKENKDHIDKLFNESLNGRSFDIPEAFLEDLDKRLDASNGRKPLFFWWFTGLICLTGLSLVIFFSLQPSSFLSSKSATFTQSTGNNDSTIDISINSDRKPDEPAFSSTKNEPAVSNTASGKHGQIKTATITTQTAKAENQTKSTASKRFQSRIGKKDKAAKNKALINKRSATKNHSKVQSSVTLNSSGETTDKSILKNTPVKPEEKITDSGITKTKTDSTAVSETKKDTTLAVTAADTTSNPLVSSEDSNETQKTNSTGNWRSEIQLFGGLGANFINDSHSDKAYLEKIRKNQSSIFAPSFGIQGNLSYKKFTFGTGLSYAQTGEKFSSETTKYIYKDSTTSEYIVDTVMVFDDSLGIWVPEIHDTTIFHTYHYLDDSTHQQTSFRNRYSWISIPLYFGYRFELGKYELIPRIGAQFNFGVAKNKGYFPTADFTGMIAYQAVTFNVSYLIQLEARRNFGRWHMFINPYFKSMISPAISGDLIRRRYSSWGIQFGVGLKL